jgi:hypothetical protein
MGIAVAVPCTERKRGGRPSAAASLRTLDAGLQLGRRAEIWADRLVEERAVGENLPLSDLYVGPGWTASTQLVADLQASLESQVEGFVVSAGLGLQRLGDDGPRWPRYSATFTMGNPDSVATMGADPGQVAPAWWSLLEQQAPLGGTSFAALAGTRDRVLVVASVPYLRAVSDDLVAAADAGLRVIIYTSSALRLPALEPFLVRFDARARKVVPASDARASADFVAFVAGCMGEEMFDASAAQRFVESVLDGQPRPVRPRGASSLPDDVRKFIAEELRKNGSVRKGPLLRRWRDGGRAFEQKRFGAIYDEVFRDLRSHSSDAGKGPSSD